MKRKIDHTALSLVLKNRYLQRIRQNSTPMGDCLIWNKSVNTSGYPQMRFCFPGHNSQMFLAHRIAFSFYNNYILNNEQWDVSHICHKKRCVSINHLVYEPKSVNAQRRSCVLLDRCFGHDPYENCNLYLHD